MGLTKQYLAYRHAGSFNIIASGRPNISFATYNRIDGRYILSGGAENAILWDLRLGEKILELRRDKFEVTALRPSPDRVHVSVGYSDGAVVVFDLKTQSPVCSLAIHKTAVNILRYDKLGMRLASGGQDTDVVISDMVTQMGLCRLVGHNAPVTDVHFMEHFGIDDVIVTTSKDTQIKFWNVETQNCFKTIVDNRTEVWGLGLVGEFLISGCGHNAMNVYRIRRRDQSDTAGITGLVEGLSIDDEDSVSPFTIANCGSIQRAGKGRVVNLVMDESGRVLSCHGTNDLIENFYVCSKEESMSRLAKRMKKLSTDEQSGRNNDVSLADEIKRLPSIKTGTKIKSLDVLIGLNDELRVIVNNANNSLKLFSINIKQKKSEATLLKTIAQCGHQSEVRNICFSSDSLALVSGSAESLKVWNRETMQCLRTVETDYILSSCFVPGDRHVILGTKTGQLLIVDIANGEILEDIPAHKGELWSICLLPDLKGCVTGSGDTTVKFWYFELIESDNNADESSSKTKVLSLLHKNTLKLEETVLCVRTSPNGKFIAVGLLDSTVKIFFLDSLKFYLSLYGHKLPVLCMDISYDSTLIATGSADRNVKIWGLDFGDCHKSLFAHDDSVMGLQFIPKTHMFFTCGKDGKMKQWDADIFQKIMTFPGHIGEAYGLSVSSNGLFVSCCGSDRTIRIYERTDEPIVLQDVQEEEREEQENQTLATGDDNAVPTLPGLKLPSRKTVGAEQAAESIIECLDICKEFDPDSKELHPLMRAHEASTPDDFLIAVLQIIRAADIEEALIIVPFSYVCQMMQRMSELVNKRKDQTELISKIVFFLFQLHHKQIVSNQTLLPIITGLVKNLEAVIVNLRDMIGMNYHGLQLLQRDIESQEGIYLFRDATQAKRQRDKKMKKRQLVKRLHVHLS